MAIDTTVGAQRLRGDEEAFRWATAALGAARRREESRSLPMLEALVEDLAFGLGARSFPPSGARRTRQAAVGSHRILE